MPEDRRYGRDEGAAPGPDWIDPERAFRANILLVDDEPTNLGVLARMLEPLGQNIVSVPSGADALQRLLHDEFAIVLLDAQMPDMDGYELAAQIRQRGRTRDLPIIFISASSAGDKDISRA